MKKREAIKRAGGHAADLVRLFVEHGFDITQSAVSQWKDGEDIPELREFQLKEIRPEWFPKQKPGGWNGRERRRTSTSPTS